MPDEPVLLITGASSGIGAATARQAAADGWRLVLAARSEDKLEELAAELGGDERAVAVRCDVQSWDDQQAAVQVALDSFGRLDASLANAGFGAKRGFLEEDVDHWRDMVLTNVYGVALSIRAALARFREQGRGHMLLTGSVAGRRALPGSLYSATKWAVTAMGEALRQEVSDYRHQGHRDRARDGRHALLPRAQAGRPEGRGHRPRGHVRALPATSRGRQRGAGPAHPAAALASSA